MSESYSAQVREAILKEEGRKPCCSRAMCCGILAGATLLPGDGGGEEIISFTTEEESVVHFLVKTLKSRFGKEATVLRGSRPGHTRYTLTFSSKPLRKYLRTLEKGLPTDESERRVALYLQCTECKAAYFQGLFLGCGSMSAPESGFHLEFRLPREHADAVASLLEAFCGAPHRCTRRDKLGLYYKRSATIADFFSGIGVFSRYFDLLNVQIERQIRANENRAANCDAKNIAKTVNAAFRQVNAVKLLCESGEIDRLPQELRETAYLRLQYDNDSLSSLALRHEPPLTKSGLAHRLRKIMAFAYGEDA